MGKIKRYVPSISNSDWNIKELSKEERNKLRDRLVMGIVHTEEEYQAVIGYMYKKYPFEMDGVKIPETGKKDTAIQWNYTPYKNKVFVSNEKDPVSNKFDMYAFIYYDKERDYEPICFAGSYFKKASLDLNQLTYKNELKDIKENIEHVAFPADNILTQAIGEGYVMFCDPDYRRLGLGNFAWEAEAQLYRDISNSKLSIDNFKFEVERDE